MMQTALLAGIALSSIVVWPAFRRLPLTPLLLLGSIILALLAVRFEALADVAPVLFGFACLAVARLAVPLFVDIARQFLDMDVSQRWRTMRMWLFQAVPVLVLIAVLSIAVRYLYAELLNATVYDIEIEGSPDAPGLITGCEPSEGKKGRFLICRASGTLEKDIENSILMVSGDLKQGLSERLSARLASTETGAQSTFESVDAAIWEGADPVVPNSLKDISAGLAPKKPEKSCGIWRLMTEGGNHRRRCLKFRLLASANSLYSAQRVTARQSFASRRAVVEADLSDANQNAQFVVQRELNEAIETATKDALRANDKLFFCWNVVSSLGLAVWLTVFIKFASHRAARFVFNEQYGGMRMKRHAGPRVASESSRATIESLPLTEIDPPKGEGRLHGFQHQDDLSAWHLFSPLNLTPLSKGHPDRPLPTAVLFRRLVTRRYFTERFPPGTRFGLVGDASCTFIRISLPRDKRLAIDLRHLVAFSDGVQLSTLVDVSIAGLVQERMMLTVVSGEGEVILFSPYGAFGPIIPGGRSAPPECLVAFDVEVELVVEASDKWLAGLLGQLNVNTTRDERGTTGYALFTARLRKSPWARFWRQLRLLVTPV